MPTDPPRGPAGVRGWLGGHVEAAVWATTVHDADQRHEPYATAVAEAAAVLGNAWSDLPTRVPVGWDRLCIGPVDWVELLRRPELSPADPHPGWRHLGSAALLRAAADGVLEPLVTEAAGRGVDPAALRAAGERSGWSAEAVDGVVAFGVAARWFELDGGRLSADELRAIAGAGVIAEPAAWLRRRLRFELDWFWEPLSRLAHATRTGVPPASFARSDSAGPFRGASAEMNLPAVPLRAPAALRVARLLRLHERVVRILELGTGTAVWSRAFAAHPGSTVTTVDHPEVHAVVAPAVDQWPAPHPSFAERYTWPGGDLSRVPDSGPFDVVVLPDVLHTLSPAEIPALLRAAAEVLAPEGLLVVADVLLDRARRAPAGHLLVQAKLAVTGGGRVWDVVAVRDLLTAAGLAADRPGTVGGTQVVVARRS